MLAAGEVVFLLDVDVVFQPRKVQRSGIWDAVAGRVLIYLHKQRALEAMQRRYPAAHYVMIDPAPDLGIERIGELIDFDMSHFRPAVPVRAVGPDPEYPQAQI